MKRSTVFDGPVKVTITGKDGQVLMVTEGYLTCINQNFETKPYFGGLVEVNPNISDITLKMKSTNLKFYEEDPRQESLKKETCPHVWAEYTSLNFRETYCKTCGIKK